MLAKYIYSIYIYFASYCISYVHDGFQLYILQVNIFTKILKIILIDLLTRTAPRPVILGTSC